MALNDSDIRRDDRGWVHGHGGTEFKSTEDCGDHERSARGTPTAARAFLHECEPSDVGLAGSGVRGGRGT